MNGPERQAKISYKKRKRWEDLRQAAFAEKEWTNERLAWLFTPQGVLFAALGILLTKDTNPLLEKLRFPLLICISTIGCVIAIVVFLSVLAAALMHQKWTHAMREIAEEHPNGVTFGDHPHWPSDVARWAPVFMPVLFFGIWVGLLIYFLTHACTA